MLQDVEWIRYTQIAEGKYFICDPDIADSFRGYTGDRFINTADAFRRNRPIWDENGVVSHLAGQEVTQVVRSVGAGAGFGDQVILGDGYGDPSTRLREDTPGWTCGTVKRRRCRSSQDRSTRWSASRCCIICPRPRRRNACVLRPGSCARTACFCGLGQPMGSPARARTHRRHLHVGRPGGTAGKAGRWRVRSRRHGDSTGRVPVPCSNPLTTTADPAAARPSWRPALG